MGHGGMGVPAGSGRSRQSRGRMSWAGRAAGTCAGRLVAWSMPQPPGCSAGLETPARPRQASFGCCSIAALRYPDLWRCLWGPGWTELHSHCKPVRHAGDLHEVLHVGGAVCGSSRVLKRADACLMRSGCEVPRGALQQPAHGLCSPAPSDILLKVQHIHLWQTSCDGKLTITLQGPFS